MKKNFSQQSSSGFTLVELIMVVVVMGILSAVVAPRFVNQDAYRARFFRDDVLAAVRFAQNHAKTTGCDVRFSITNANFTIWRNANCANPALAIAYNNNSRVTRPGGANNEVVAAVVAGVAVVANVTIDFSPDGSATCAGTSNINLVSANGGRNDFIVVECATGYVYGS